MFNKCGNIGKSTNCGICLEKLPIIFGKTYKTKCNHKFHLNCIQKWLYYGGKKYCPLCRTKIKWQNPNVFLHYSGY